MSLTGLMAPGGGTAHIEGLSPGPLCTRDSFGLAVSLSAPMGRPSGQGGDPQGGTRTVWDQRGVEWREWRRGDRG